MKGDDLLCRNLARRCWNSNRPRPLNHWLKIRLFRKNVLLRMIPTQTYYSDILSGIISGIYSDILTVKTMHISTLVFFPVPWCQIHLDCSLCGCQHSFPVVKAHVRSVRLVGAWGIQLAPELWWKSRDLWTWTGQSLPVTWRRSLRSR
jgi:hypothetical protein